MGKVVKIDELLNIVSKFKKQNKIAVTTNGCFDILHAGHVRYLNRAKEFGDVLILCLNSDKSVKKIKGPTRPINNENDRAEVITALNSVDYAVIFDEETPENILARIKPDVHVKGGDYTENTLPETKIIKEGGGRVEFVPLVEGRSTTNIINKLSEKE